MVPWLQIYSNIRSHPKTSVLSETLGIQRAHAVGLMVSLWCWASCNASDGDITGIPVTLISEESGWHKKPREFYDALLGARLLDDENGRISIHDWEEYATLLMDSLERSKEQTKERMKRYRKHKQVAPVTSPLRNSDVTGDATVTSCYAPTVPNPVNTNVFTDHTVPNPSAEDSIRASGDAPQEEQKRKKTDRHKLGEYGWVRLSAEEYARMVDDYGTDTVEQYIRVVDESAQSTGNKNHWKDWNLTVRRAIRDKWGGKAAGNSGNAALAMLRRGVFGDDAEGRGEDRGHDHAQLPE